jgi:MinD-like ATPase involved in chromosome partitioning or flagellar assembly
MHDKEIELANLELVFGIRIRTDGLFLWTLKGFSEAITDVGKVNVKLNFAL